MTYEETPIRILDKKDQVLRNKSISVVKVLWSDYSVEKKVHGNWKKACVTNTPIYLCKFMITVLFYGYSIYDNIV
jgi:hypothetical protein